jgi:Fe-S-cluster containining protein
VPLTDADYERINGFDLAELGVAADTTPIIGGLATIDEEHAAFTRKLGKRPDGRCQFLDSNNRCVIHIKHGSAAKPSICQLFPYTFTETPSGVYATVNFTSSAALYNSGKALADQPAVLEEKWKLYSSLLPVSRDWSNTQLVDGIPLSWEDYTDLDQHLLELLKPDDPARIEKKLTACSRFLIQELPTGTPLERVPAMQIRPKTVDQLLVRRLFELYMDDDLFACTVGDLYGQAFIADLSEPPQTVQLRYGDKTYTINSLYSFSLGKLDEESENLLSRFVYSKVFGKLYFGAGFAQLSVLAGIHHLQALVALIRLKAKIHCIEHDLSKPDFLTMAEIVIGLERRLLKVSFSPESAKVFELFLTSPERVERIMSLSA